MTRLEKLIIRRDKLFKQYREVCHQIQIAKGVKQRPKNGSLIMAALKQVGYTKGIGPITGIYLCGGDKYPSYARVQDGPETNSYYPWRKVVDWQYVQGLH